MRFNLFTQKKGFIMEPDLPPSYDNLPPSYQANPTPIGGNQPPPEEYSVSQYGRGPGSHKATTSPGVLEGLINAIKEIGKGIFGAINSMIDMTDEIDQHIINQNFASPVSQRTNSSADPVLHAEEPPPPYQRNLSSAEKNAQILTDLERQYPHLIATVRQDFFEAHGREPSLNEFDLRQLISFYTGTDAESEIKYLKKLDEANPPPYQQH